MKIDELTQGCRVAGVPGYEWVEVLVTIPSGPSTRLIADTGAGKTIDVLLTSDQIESLEPIHEGQDAYDADPDEFRLAVEALRMSRADSFDPFLAVHSSSIQPLPHQISAVYEKMLPMLPLRYVLADDPGAGKTIMCGLLVKEMLARGDLRRCLIVCPGSLCTQWQDELRDKFGLTFTIVTRELLEASPSRNAFKDNDLLIARLDQLSRSEELQELLDQVRWDLVVFDEAHKLSASLQGREVKKTGRYRLAEQLGASTENLLLMTATPHNGKPGDFQLFLSLVDKDRFAGVARATSREPEVGDVMRRLVKEQLVTFEGKPLFPERRSYTVKYQLSPAEKDLYEQVTTYVREGFNRAAEIGGKRGSSVGFALTMLQRRLASSPEALYQSLRRRHERLQRSLQEAMGQTPPHAAHHHGLAFFDDFDEDDLDAQEQENVDDLYGDDLTASQTVEELAAEVEDLGRLTALARSVRDSGQDTKWTELREVLSNQEMFGPGGRREKLIVFTEHKDTLGYLERRIGQYLGEPEAVVTITGGMGRDARKAAQERFLHDPRALILLATDAAGEGVNLQRAHLMVSYDLPWNPNRLEQRFGRIHRIGQTEVCHLWNLVAADTREGQVYARLLEKLEKERHDLKAPVFDVLGQVTFGGKTLADLLKEAIRYGEDPKVRERLNKVVDDSLDRDALRELLRARALTDDVLGEEELHRVREEMLRAQARKLEPHYVGAFFCDALRRLGGKVVERERGRYEVTRVPNRLSLALHKLGIPRGFVQERYERVCFDPHLVDVPGKPRALLACPGVPLFDALVRQVLDDFGDALERGALLVDDTDWGTECRLLCFEEDCITDGRLDRFGERSVVARFVDFVFLKGSGEATSAGFAPHLDLRAPDAAEAEVLRNALGSLVPADGKELAENYANGHLVPSHLRETERRRLPRIQKTRYLVKTRLDAEVEYWQNRAWEAAEEGKATGRDMSVTVRSHEVRAHELEQRRDVRMATLDAEESLLPSPAHVTARAVVVPRGLLAALMPGTYPEADRRRQVEAIAMERAMAHERSLGNDPEDVSAQHVGYDILSRVPGGDPRFIEVKGVSAGEGQVTVTANEVRVALNSPDQWRLALVRVEGEGLGAHAARLQVLERPFVHRLDDTAASVSYDVESLAARAVAEWDRWYSA